MLAGGGIPDMARGRSKKKRRQERSGYVYVLTNRSMPGMVKIGFTSRSAGVRANELSGATGVPTDFKIVFQARARDALSLEKAVHRRLRHARVKQGREFFRVSPRRARKEIVKEMRQLRGVAQAYWVVRLVITCIVATAGVALLTQYANGNLDLTPLKQGRPADLSVWIGILTQSG